MLSIKNLVKVYKTKGGTEVRALDNVSVDFPEKGMVFLLGKSGSGKSTLLNVAGGLDRPDSGEVIVKGKSSKSFSAADFDSYRNTYVGFVFQEYNILDEFNIEQNIALALQLQGKKNDKNEVNALLKQVDLEGLGKRKPNTLSGGQKQRVAIARALIKEPEIIMADEPTGALDSNTGKQVFDTLKKLSADKLVIVVSHDREFAEQYADRIIELKDGKILSDTSKALAAPKALSANVGVIGTDTVRVKDWNKLTQDDFNQIRSMMQGHRGEVIISSSETDMPAIKRVCKIADDGSKEYFKETDSGAVEIKQYDASKTKFIKSRMPAARAMKMGASGLKTKPVRLFFTILLSVLSFAMFGVLSTMMMYDPIYSVAEAMQGTTYQSAKLDKQYKFIQQSWQIDPAGNKTLQGNPYETTGRALFGVGEVEELNKNSVGLRFAGVCGADASFSANLSGSSKIAYYEAFNGRFSGFTDCGKEYMTENGFKLLAGAYPTTEDEVAISEYYYEGFKECGYNDSGIAVTIDKPEDLIGKKIDMRLGGGMYNVRLTISGVYSLTTLEHFRNLKQDDTSAINPDELEKIKKSMSDEVDNGFHSLGFVTPEFCEKYKTGFDSYINTVYINSSNIDGVRFDYDGEVEAEAGESYFSQDTVNGNKGAFDFYTTDGKPTTVSAVTLTKDEAYSSVMNLARPAMRLAEASKPEQVVEYLNKNGEKVYISRQDYREINEFYADYAGNISFTEKAGYVKIEGGKGFINASGEFRPEYDKSEGDLSGWKFIDGYWLDYDGNFIADVSGFESRESVIYTNDAGDMAFEKKEGYDNPHYAFYRTADGKTFLNPPDKLHVSYEQIKGFFVNPATGALSMEYTPGSVLTDHYYKNNATDKIVFATHYDTTWYDKSNRPIVCPYNGMQYIMERQLQYRDKNVDFDDASLRLQKASGAMGDMFDSVGELTAEDIELIISCINRDWSEWVNDKESAGLTKLKAKNSKGRTAELTIKGYYLHDRNNGGARYILADEFVKDFEVVPPGKDKEDYQWGSDMITDYVAPADARYGYVISLTRNTQEQTHFMLDERNNGVVKYSLCNMIYSEVSFTANMIDMLKLVFLIAGAVMAVLSALLLFNFISVSISSKRKEIGILRAVGARGSDVFKIFFAEAAIIALISFILSAVAAGIVCFVLNGIFTTVVAISVLNYGLINIALILGISVVIAFIATILPVYFAAKKPPVESIRAL